MIEDVRSPVIVGNFEVALALTQSRTIKMMGYVFKEDAAEDINARVDAMQDVIDRQAVRSDVQNKEAQKAAALEALEQHAGFMADMADKQKSNKPLATVEKERLKTTDGTVRGLKRNIASLEAAIEAGKKKLNGAHAP